VIAQRIIFSVVKATVVYLTENFAAHGLWENSVMSFVNSISTAAMA
jgi:hypothetical protein